MKGKKDLSLAEAVAFVKAAKGRQDSLRRAYDLMTERYYGERLRMLRECRTWFANDPAKNWRKRGFLHCTNMNALLRYLLLESGRFSPEDVTFRWTLIWYCSPHQYARVRCDGKWVDVDLWAHAYGVTLGKHAHGLRSGSLRARERKS
jgi:hypothetical protein